MARQGKGGARRLMLLMVGGAIGAAAGLLFAPRTGKETRDQLMSKAEEMMHERDGMMGCDITDRTADWKNRIDTARERLLTSIDSASLSIKDRVNQSAEKATEKINEMEEKAEQPEADITAADLTVVAEEEEKKEETI